MAFNQSFNETQAMASPPLPVITNSQIINSHVYDQQPQQQQPYHVYPLPHPNNQAPTFAIPNLPSTDLISMEFSQLSFEINNQRVKMEEDLLLQYLQTANAIMMEQNKQDILVQNYVSKLVGLIHEKEQELVITNHENFELKKCKADFESKLTSWQLRALEKEATVANLNQELDMIQKSHQMMMTSNEPDAGSSCGDDLTKDMVDINCQMCGRELSCVLIFPCKHLCCCTPCEGYVYSCPVCGTVKESSIEVSWPQMKKQGAN